MAFYGCSFSYNNIDSNLYGLRIGEFNAQGVNESMASSSMQIREQKLFRRATPFFFGSETVSPLEFEMQAFSENDIDEDLLKLIQRDFFSSRTYHPLMIEQPDMADTYFNCILNEPRVISNGNLIQGIKFKVRCDAPFAWKYPQTTTQIFTPPVSAEQLTIYNGSDDGGAYLYPSLVITMSDSGGNMSITNTSDNDRVFSFTGLSADEVITIDNSLQQLSSSTALNRLSTFNKHFLRLLPGANILEIDGEVLSISFTMQFVSKKISG